MGDIDRHHLVRAWLDTLPSAGHNNTPPHASPPPEEGSLLEQAPAGDTRSFVLPASGFPPDQRGEEGGDHGISYQQPTSATLTSHTPRPLHPLGDSPVHAPNQPCTPPAIPGKRKRPSHSKSSNSLSTPTPSPTPSEVLAKRRALQFLTASSVAPPPSIQPPVASVPHFPSHVLTVLRLLAPAQFELHCLPFTPHIGTLLDTFFPTEFFPPHTRLDILAPEDPSRALAFLDLITRVHATCVHNFSNGLDETAWYPCIRTLLSIDPPPPSSHIPTLPPPDPHVPSPAELFLTLNATTKPTLRNIPPDLSVKLDYLLAFNPNHADCQSTTTTIRHHNLTVNAFNDTTIEEVIVLLGVKVKPLLGAESQVSVWAAKTLALTRSMSPHPPPPAETCDLAVSLTVYGHVWSVYVTYWNSEGSIVTQGPVLVGSTDTVYGTLKIVRFVVVLKEWARSKVLEDWKGRVQVAVG